MVANFPKIVRNELSLIMFSLIKTNKRLTFDIKYQHPELVYTGLDDGEYYKFTASNGYEIISRSQMDIQTERLYLLGAKGNTRSGSMVFGDNAQRDIAYIQFNIAIEEWRNAIDAI